MTDLAKKTPGSSELLNRSWQNGECRLIRASKLCAQRVTKCAGVLFASETPVPHRGSDGSISILCQQLIALQAGAAHCRCMFNVSIRHV
eukprot:6193078-Pleurochrysis_carterae.AAC.1